MRENDITRTVVLRIWHRGFDHDPGVAPQPAHRAPYNVRALYFYICLLGPYGLLIIGDVQLVRDIVDEQNLFLMQPNTSFRLSVEG